MNRADIARQFDGVTPSNESEAVKKQKSRLTEPFRCWWDSFQPNVMFWALLSAAITLGFILAFIASKAIANHAHMMVHMEEMK